MHFSTSSKTNSRLRFRMYVLLVLLVSASAAGAQTSSFTYQGKLTDGGMPANGNYDLQFTLWDSASLGTQQPQPSPVTVTRSNVTVSGGIFTVQLDFSVSAFPGADRFLEVSVRLSGAGAFTTLSPRQQISSTPYAIRTLGATAADSLSSSCVVCVQDAQINSVAGSKINGTIPVASVPAGSSNYVQNTTSPQPGANFNISGNGTVGGNLTANGNVGIGTAGPGGKLHVAGVEWFFAPVVLTGQSGIVVGPSLDLDATPAGGHKYSVISTGPSAGAGAGKWTIYDDTTHAYQFVLDAFGNVGIGTTNPALGRLQVEGGGGNGVVGVSSLGFGVFGNSSAPNLNVGAGVVGSNGSTGVGVYGNSSSGTGVFGQSFSGGIGMQGFSNTGTGVLGQSNSGYAGYFQGGLGVNVTSNVCAANISCASDVRLKQDIRPLSYGLRELQKLHPVRWRWKDTTTTQLNLGLVAQELEPVLPELLLRGVDNKGSLGLNYMGLIPVLVKGIQEQQAEIEKQQKEIERLKQQVGQLQAAVHRRRVRRRLQQH